MFNRKKKLGRRTIKQWFIHIVRRLLRKEYCKICGQELTEIRGKKYTKKLLDKIDILTPIRFNYSYSKNGKNINELYDNL